jgi:transposase
MAPSLDEMVSAGSDVRVLSEVMDRLDWSYMEASYSDNGRPAYPPTVIAKILVYAYSKGIRSSRRIEELVESDLRYIWLAGGLKPDFHTIARFRKERFSELSRLFVSSVRLCAEAGLVLMRAVAADGSKIRANASRKSLYDGARVSREREAVERILQEAEETDRVEDEQYGEANGRELPEELRDAAKRKAKLDEIAQRLKENGRKVVSTSDEECRLMKTSSGIRPSYNVQAVVDSENQVIVAAEASQNEHDHGQLPELLEQVRENMGLSPDVIVADTGYSDEQTLQELDKARQEAVIPPKEHPREKGRNDLFSRKCFVPDEGSDALVCPAGRLLHFQGEYKAGSGVYRQYGATGCQSCSFHKECVGDGHGSRRVMVSTIAALRGRMREKLETAEGRATFALRKRTVEPVFGQIKHNLGFDRFLLRGINGASAEFALICLAHNISKCARHLAPTGFALLQRVVRTLLRAVPTQTATLSLPSPANARAVRPF